MKRVLTDRGQRAVLVVATVMAVVLYIWIGVAVGMALSQDAQWVEEQKGTE